jgi:hypothetical protein
MQNIIMSYEYYNMLFIKNQETIQDRYKCSEGKVKIKVKEIQNKNRQTNKQTNKQTKQAMTNYCVSLPRRHFHQF